MEGEALREEGSADLAAVRALAEHLDVTPQDIDAWLHRPGGLPPKVLLSWICLWDLKGR